MLKKIFLVALVAISTFGISSISEAHHNNYCRDSYCYRENLCCSNYYTDNGDYNNCYGNGDCYSSCGRGYWRR